MDMKQTVPGSKPKWRKWVVGFGVFFFSMLLLAILIPFLFKDKILELVKREANKQLNAVVQFDDLNVSLIRNFPKASISLENLSVVNHFPFSGDTLIQAKEINVAVSLFSLLRGSTYQIHRISVQEAFIQLMVNKDGFSNWDIMKQGETVEDVEDSAASFSLDLAAYDISSSRFIYKDEQSNIYTEWNGLEHKGSGDLTAARFNLSTLSKVESVSFRYGGIPYLSRVNTVLNTDILIDTDSMMFRFDTRELSLNDFSINSSGFFQLVNDSTYNMDISLQGVDQNFKSILSLIPAIYQKDFDQLETKGEADFKAHLKGIYSPVSLPAYDLFLNISNGYFKYPDLPAAVSNIHIEAKIQNPSGTEDDLLVNLQKAHLEMDGQPFDARFVYSHPISKKLLDASLKGTLNLGTLNRFIKLENQTQVAGTLNADIYAKGSLQETENALQSFQAGGDAQLQNFSYQSADLPFPISKGRMELEVFHDPLVKKKSSISIANGGIQLGNNPVEFFVQIDDPFRKKYFSGGVEGAVDLTMVKELAGIDPGTTLAGLLRGNILAKGNYSMIEEEKYDQILLNGAVQLSKLTYQSKLFPDPVQIPNASIAFQDGALSLKDLQLFYAGSNVQAEGKLANPIGYALYDGDLSGNVRLKADKIDLNRWMKLLPTEDSTTTNNNTEKSENSAADAALAEPFRVPEKINLVIDAEADAVQYDKVLYEKVKGRLRIAEETVFLQNMSTQALGGNVVINGSYSTQKQPLKPEISLQYDVKEVDVQKAFFAYNTVQKLMPIGQFLGGKLNSAFSMTGNLGKDMMPLLQSLSGKGNLLLIDGFLKKFQPLEKMALALQVNELKEISIREIKNYFEFDHGQVLVKPFSLKVKDIEMEIGGSHGLDQSLQYIIQMKLPRRLLGTQGQQLVNGLQSNLAKTGFSLPAGETIDLSVNLRGTVTQPDLQYNLKGAVADLKDQLKEQTQQFVQAKIDSAKATVRDTLQQVKKELLQSAANDLRKKLLGSDSIPSNDSSSQKPTPNTKEALKEAEQKLKGGLKNILNRKKDTSSKN